MGFRATPQAVIELLLVLLAVWALAELGKHRFASNWPVLFYIVVFAFAQYTRTELNMNVMLGGLLLAFVLRFEFLNGWITNVILVLEVFAIFGLSALLLADAFDFRYYR